MLPSPTLRVAVGQAPVEAGDLVGNARIAADLVRRATAEGVRLLVLGEAFLTGYGRSVFAGALPGVEELADRVAPVVRAAVAGDCTVVASAALDRGGHRTLSTVLVRPDGTVSAPYDKQHLAGYERDRLTAGDHGCSVLVDGWSWGLSICYDACFPEHARAAAEAGDLGYLNSAAFFPGGAARQETHNRARALDNGFYVLHAALTGRCGEETFIGGSGVFDPEGVRLGGLGDENGLVAVDLSHDRLLAVRAQHTMHRDRLPDLGGRFQVG